jgi:voltage-gated potassium channel
MGANQHPPEVERVGLVERRAERIANARSVTFGLAATFFALALVGAIVMRIADSHNFPSVGLATWWALQTVTTVGYGDVVPTTTAGKIVGAIEMVFGISLISLLTAAVTSTVVQRGQAAATEKDRIRDEQTRQTVVEGLAQLDDRLSRIESELRKT